VNERDPSDRISTDGDPLPYGRGSVRSDMPTGVNLDNERDKSRRVREMFEAIAGRYDFLNHFLSLNTDRRWRQTCVREVRKRVRVPSPRILDIGCGTADLSLAFSGMGPVVGCDFCQPMLRIGAEKIARNNNRQPVVLLGADALRLPFPGETFDVAVSAFVLRNLASIETGLGEMRRVLRNGGVLAILEFGMPRSAVLGGLYRFYFLCLLPKIGRFISGVDGAYGYLPISVQAFPQAEQLKEKVERAGFRDVRFRLLTGGIAVLVTGIADKTRKKEDRSRNSRDQSEYRRRSGF
jgi:demethylmenaquinone methyltransferase/2-methoxy-6-polyprenyl-1,4-benzoquinol methylase